MSTRRPATLLDVARRAGVGKSTASNALTGSGRIAEATRQSVLSAAAELGYVPNRAARHLRRGATGTIGVHLPQTPTRSEYYMRFVFGVLEQAREQDLDVAVLSGGRTQLPQVDGVVLADPTVGDAFADRVLASSLPVVTCERVVAGPAADGTVWADHTSAVERLLDHLHDRGARRPALVLPREQGDWTAQVREGWSRWCARHDVPVRSAPIPWVPAGADLTRAVEDLLDADPELDALVCGPVETAAMALPALRARGREVGTDLLLACGADSSALALSDPTITALDLVPDTAGRECARMLHGLMSGELTPGAQHELTLGLVERASTRGR